MMAFALGVVPAGLAASVVLLAVLVLWYAYTRPAAEGETGRVMRSTWGTVAAFAFALVMATVLGAAVLAVRVRWGTLTVRPRRAGGVAASVPVDLSEPDAEELPPEPGEPRAPLAVVRSL